MRKAIKRLSEVINIKRSKDNHDVIVKQELIYTPKKCEDCPRICKWRRTVHHKISFAVKPSRWIHFCSVCKQYYNPKTKKFNTSWNGLISHYLLNKDSN